MNVICVNKITTLDHLSGQYITINCGSKFTITLKSEFDNLDNLKQEVYGTFVPYLIGNASKIRYVFLINSSIFNECFKIIN